jgi:acetylornithine/N-succinyldiaminopimelate aminotransferase
VNIPDDDYFQRLRAWCDQNNILLILDEVQTGMGRLGSLFGYEEYNVEPDVMILAKGLGFGVPIGAFLAKENAMALTYGDHGSTFGGNPLTTAAAAAGTRYLLDNDILGHVKQMEVVLKDRLNALKSKYGFVNEIRCKGLLAAVAFDSDIMPQVMDAAEAAGVLLNGVRPNAVRIMPALNISEAEIDQGVGRLDTALGNV